MDTELPEADWDDPEIFEGYEDHRWIHRPASAVVVKDTIDEFAQEGILEIGCGVGELTLLAGENFSENTVQIDKSPRLVEANKARFPKSNVEIGDICNLEFPDSTFGTVIGYSVLDTLYDLASGIREIHRVLKEDGTLIHFLDMSPNVQVIMNDYGDKYVLFPHPILYPVSDDPHVELVMEGLTAIDKQEYYQKRSQIDPDELKILDFYVENPQVGYSKFEGLPIDKRIGTLSRLREIFQQTGLGEAFSTEDYFRRKLEDELNNNGFHIEQSGLMSRDIIIPRNQKHTEDHNDFSVFLGFNFPGNNPQLKPDEVKVSSTLYVAVARAMK